MNNLSTLTLCTLILLIVSTSCGCINESRLITEYKGVDLVHPDIKDVPILIEGLKSWDPEVRLAIAFTFHRLGEDGKEAIPALIKYMKRRSNSIEASAPSRALGNMGLAAAEALIEHLNDDKGTFRLLVVNTLGDIGADAEQALPILENMAETDRYTYDDEYVIREAARTAIERISKDIEQP